jgi:hypothetical protein
VVRSQNRGWGERVTLEWAYADERFVAVLLRMGRPVKSAPALYDDTVGNEAALPPHVQITDASGQDFDTVGGTFLPPRRTGAEAVFDAPEGIEPANTEHRFRLEVPLMEDPSGKMAKQGPFVFDFEVSVAEAPTYSVDQEVEAEGIVMTL